MGVLLHSDHVMADPSSRPGADPVRVMIVDDSLTVRTVFSRMIKLADDMIVVGTASTAESGIAELAATFLKNPLRVEVTPVATTAERVEQSVIYVEALHKQFVLHELLKDPSIDRALVFARTKHGTDRLAKRLSASGFHTTRIHGDRTQNQRNQALAGFKKGDHQVDPFADDKPLFTIDAGNMDRYADKLPDGLKAMLKQ